MSPTPFTALVLLALTLAAPAAMASPWSKVKTSSPGPALAIGAAANGCIAGAEALPPEGEGFVSIRRERNRFYGHPDTLDLVRDLGRQVAQNGSGLVLVGDLAQPRGGLMSSSHRSHQNGMDVDLWFSFAPSAREAWRRYPEGKAPPSMVGPDGRSLAGAWGSGPAGPAQGRRRAPAHRPHLRQSRDQAGPVRDARRGTAPGCAGCAPGGATTPTSTCASAAPPTAPNASPSPRSPPGRGAERSSPGGSARRPARRRRSRARLSAPRSRRPAARCWGSCEAPPAVALERRTRPSRLTVETPERRARGDTGGPVSPDDSARRRIKIKHAAEPTPPLTWQNARTRASAFLADGAPQRRLQTLRVHRKGMASKMGKRPARSSNLCGTRAGRRPPP
jgi:hypothetical protein